MVQCVHVDNLHSRDSDPLDSVALVLAWNLLELFIYSFCR